MFPEVCVLLTTQSRLQNQERTDADELRLGSGPISTMSILIDAHLRFDLCASKHNSCSCKTRLAQPATISMALHNRPLAGVIWMPDLTERTFLSSPNISPQPRIRSIASAVMKKQSSPTLLPLTTLRSLAVWGLNSGVISIMSSTVITMINKNGDNRHP